jgi:hypothetical protein
VSRALCSHDKPMRLPEDDQASLIRQGDLRVTSCDPMRFRILTLVVVAGSCAMIRCSRAVPEQSSSTTAASPAATSVASAPPSPASMPTFLPGSGLPLAERFAMEAQSRPKTGLTVERVHAAWRSAGITLTEEKQHLGAPFEAKYCVGSKVAMAVAASVCEYSDAAAAEHGKATSSSAFRAVSDREIIANGSTTLTVRINEVNDANRALAAKMKQTFTALKP